MRTRFLWIVASLLLGLSAKSFAQAPVEPTIVRINGTRALTGKLLPAVAAQQKLGKASISEQDIDHGEFTILGFGSTWKTYLTDVSLNIPVASDSLSSAFKSAPANKAEIDTNYQFKNATLKMKLHVRTGLKTPFDGILPPDVKAWTTVREAFDITANGFTGEFDLTLKKNSNFVEVESVDKFNVQIDKISVTDSLRLLELANKIASVAKFFKVPGTTTVNEGATKMANDLLKEKLEVRKDLRDALNESLNRFTQIGLGTQTVPLPQQGQFTVSGAFESLQTIGATVTTGTGVPLPIPGVAFTQWSIDVHGKPSGALPNLAYAYLPRPAQDMGQLGPQGDVEVFIPYSLVDKTMYELIQMGSLGKITVPQSTTSGITVGFDMKAEPTEIPRANPVAKQPGVLAFEFGARIANTQVGTVNTGSFIPKDTIIPRNPVAPTNLPALKTDALKSKETTAKPLTPVTDPRRDLIPDTLPVMLTNGSARVTIYYQLQANNIGGLFLRYVGVAINQLTGNLAGAGKSVPLNQLGIPIQNAINAHLAKTQPQVTLIQRAVQVVPGVSVQVGMPRIGNRYIGLPLTLVAN